MIDMEHAGDATRAVALGRGSHDPGAPLNVPPVLASTFRAGGTLGYARVGNPTWTSLEETLAGLERATHAVTFASGMAAVSAVLDLAPVGGVVVAQDIAYSGTRALVAQWAERGRIRVRWVEPTTEALVAAAAGADLVMAETPVNPTLEEIDLRPVAAATRAAGALLAVDATFATPLGARPLQSGADVVVHSATKFLSGHSDVLLGAVLTDNDGLATRIRSTRTLVGGIPGPMEAWLALRGVRTFPLRWERATASAAVLARRLRAAAAGEPVVFASDTLPLSLSGLFAAGPRGVRYPGWGAILSIDLPDAATADRCVEALELWVSATSLGGVESTVERRRRWPEESPRVPEGLVRLSVGIEDVEDLWADLVRALARAGG